MDRTDPYEVWREREQERRFRMSDRALQRLRIARGIETGRLRLIGKDGEPLGTQKKEATR